MKKHLVLGALAAFAALACAESTSAHARMSPPVALAKEGQVFTLAVPTEKEGATTTSIELTPPTGFSIDSFVPAPGWKRTVPTGEDAAFSFIASTTGTGTYTFGVRQTYSDGTVVNWSGPESSDTPSP